MSRRDELLSSLSETELSAPVHYALSCGGELTTSLDRVSHHIGNTRGVIRGADESNQKSPLNSQRLRNEPSRRAHYGTQTIRWFDKCQYPHCGHAYGIRWQPGSTSARSICDSAASSASVRVR